MSAGALAARLTLDANGFKTEMMGASAVSDRELKKIQRQVQFVNDYIREMAKSQREVGVASADIGKASAHMEEFSLKSAGAKRELAVLAHEMSQGNFQRLGGSLLVLQERTNWMGAALSGAGIAIVGAVAAFGALAIAAAKGHAEQDAFNKSIIATGNFAGVTSSSFDALAKSVSGSTGQSLTKAKEALQGLVSTGQIGPSALGQMATAVQLVAHNTGTATDEVVRDFAKMAEAPAKWAEEHNKAWHFVSGEQYAYIKRLEEQGKAEEAALFVSQKVVDHFATKLAPNLGYIEQAWKGIAGWADKAWENMKGLGKTQTVDAQLAKVERDLKTLADRKAMNILAGTPDANPDDSKQAGRLAAQREGLMRDKQIEAEVAWRHSLGASTEKARIAAVDYIAKIAEETKGTTLATKEIEKYRRQVELLRGTENEVSAKTQAAQEAAIRKRYMGAAGKAGKFDAWAGVDPALVVLAYERAAAKAAEYAQINKDVESAVLSRYAAEHKAVEEQAKLQAEQDKSFDKWFQTFNKKDTALSTSDAIGKYLRDIGDQSKAAEQLVTGAFSRMEDAIVNFVHTGHLSFKDLWTFMADEYLRNQIRMQEKKLLDSAGNFDWGKAISTVGSWFSGWGEHADGLAYVPSNGYPAILHEGERVMTRQDNVRASSGAGGVHIDNSGQVFNVGQGVSRGEMAAAVQQGNAQTEARIRRLMRNGNIGS
jgi:lambda family phage tail tape measure protein